MTTFTLVADKYDIRKLFKHDSRHFGKLCNPEVLKLENKDKYILKAESYAGCCGVSLIDYKTSDYHMFDSKQDAINAWIGHKPKGTSWNH